MDAVEKVSLLRVAYRRFGNRDVEGLLAMMTPDVEWPDVANAVVLQGPEAVRPYWVAQFAVADPRLEPTDFLAAGDDVVAVVRQQVFAHDGQPLTEATTVYHRYSFRGDLVSRMVVFEDRAAATA